MEIFSASGDVAPSSCTFATVKGCHAPRALDTDILRGEVPGSSGDVDRYHKAAYLIHKDVNR